MNIFQLDYQILKAFNQFSLPYLNIIFLFAIYAVYIYLALLAFVILKNKDRKKLSHLIFACIVGYALVLGMKYTINRPRPCETHSDIECVIKRADPSFPSAHTFVSFLSAYFIPKYLNKQLRRISYIYLLVLIPLGSLYVGVHYPLDIFFGALIGIISPFVFSEKLSNRILMRFV
jgi:undecaprenyl-diphosphatase